MPQQSSTGNKVIYLAGKITQPDWRHTIVTELWKTAESWSFNSSPLSEDAQWPIIPRAIFDSFDYGGPFFTNFSDAPHRDIPAHGVQVEQYPGPFCWKHSGDTPRARRDVIQLCLNAIERADLVFAWIDSLDCYGTLYELGYAKACGKPLAVYFSCGDFWGGDPEPTAHERSFYDLWFAYFACDSRHAADPESALSEALHSRGWFWLQASYDSPLETMFAHEWVRRGLHLLYPLTPQQEVKGGAYRIDFAYEPVMFGIELDGYTYHSDRDAFNRDRKRQREIEALGWRITRFSGDELRADISACVREAARMLDIHKRTKE